MSTDYGEDKLIQKSTAEFLEKELGWTLVYAYDKEVLGENALWDGKVIMKYSWCNASARP